MHQQIFELLQAPQVHAQLRLFPDGGLADIAATEAAVLAPELNRAGCKGSRISVVRPR
jgi:hypothetical protein